MNLEQHFNKVLLGILGLLVIRDYEGKGSDYHIENKEKVYEWIRQNFSIVDISEIEDISTHLQSYIQLEIWPVVKECVKSAGVDEQADVHTLEESQYTKMIEIINKNKSLPSFIINALTTLILVIQHMSSKDAKGN